MAFPFPCYDRSSQGFIGIITVLIVSVLTLAIAVSAVLSSANERLLEYETLQTKTVLLLADGCIDEAAYRLKLNSAYTGGTVPYSNGSCTVSVSGSGTTRTITSTVTVNNITRSIQAGITLLDNTALNAKGIDVTSWTE